MLTTAQNVPPSMSIEVEAGPEETNLGGSRMSPSKISLTIEKCVFSSSVTADEMDNEDKLISKDAKQVG